MAGGERGAGNSRQPLLQRGEGPCGKVFSGTSLGQQAFDLHTAITPASQMSMESPPKQTSNMHMYGFSST